MFKGTLTHGASDFVGTKLTDFGGIENRLVNSSSQKQFDVNSDKYVNFAVILAGLTGFKGII